MILLDYLIFALYMVVVLAVGLWFFRRNKDAEDYYVGGRSVSAAHVGLSVVATDVGGGFSIGLGGVGFLMGLAGSWLLFTGLLGAWLSAIFIIPRVKRLDSRHGMLTYPDFLRHTYGDRVAAVAAVISGIGYLGFTGGQILAGAKLAAGTVVEGPVLGLSPMQFSLIAIGFMIVVYTMLGGLKAVIYTDTVQWVILLVGLIFFAIPFALQRVGGWQGLRTSLPDRYFDLTAIEPITLINWFVTIIPIWLVAMTLYQRIYACRDQREARKAWFIAGLFEYPVMAFMGVILGMCARVLFPEAEPEMGLPMLIKSVLPVGVTGIVVAAYFSAIMSTADSCLMASSGNVVNDLLQRTLLKNSSDRTIIRISQVTTGLLGVLAVLLAALSEDVLDAILHAYAFLVSGLFVPTLGAYFWRRATPAGALSAMLLGGGTTLTLIVTGINLPGGLDASIFGISLSAIVFVIVSLVTLGGSVAPLEESES
ncbi:MAG: sodium:solute symporter family protein [Pseudomonadota bacterium]